VCAYLLKVISDGAQSGYLDKWLSLPVAIESIYVHTFSVFIDGLLTKLYEISKEVSLFDDNDSSALVVLCSANGHQSVA